MVTADDRVKQAFFIVESNREQLIRVGDLLDAGRLRTAGLIHLDDLGRAAPDVLRKAIGRQKVADALWAVRSGPP